MFVSIGMIIGIMTAMIAFRKIEFEPYKPTSKLYIPFYRLSIPIVEVLLKQKKGLIQNVFLKPVVIERLKQINPTDRTTFHIKKFYVEKIALSILLIFTGSILTLLASFGQKKESAIIEDKYVERGSYQEGEKSKEFIISIQDELKEQDIKVTISGQLLTENEVKTMFAEAKSQIESLVKGSNPSLMEVRSKLVLPTRIEGLPLTISWETSNFEVVGTNGEINNQDIEEKGTLVNLIATLHCQEYEDKIQLPLKILPPLLTDEERVRLNLSKQLKQADERDQTSKYIELPLSINGKTIVWSEPKDNTAHLIWILGIFSSILIYIGKDKDLEKKIKKRSQQLLTDYPDIVSKLTLLLGAGMTVKGAWQKIALDYREKKQIDKKYFRYAYEEMLISYYEITSGVSEAYAYEEFGKRMKNQRYMKMISLITQNLKKGSKGLSKILENESLDAFEDRKAYAKVAGEEASTKLMLPMFLNLVVVLIIIMIPACMSFQM